MQHNESVSQRVARIKQAYMLIPESGDVSGLHVSLSNWPNAGMATCITKTKTRLRLLRGKGRAVCSACLVPGGIKVL